MTVDVAAAAPVELMKVRLQVFLERNTSSTIEEVPDKDGAFQVRDPWGDESVVLEFTGDDHLFIECMNNIILPERFSAVWHEDDRRLEIIYTALKLSPRAAEVRGRKFSFTHKGHEYSCAFALASERLLKVAEHSKPAAPSQTDYRNLRSFNNYVAVRKKRLSNEASPEGPESGAVDEAEPLSFWIDGINKWNEDAVLDLVTHLNFYMHYYDTFSPLVIVHSAKRLIPFVPVSLHIAPQTLDAFLVRAHMDQHAEPLEERQTSLAPGVYGAVP